MQSKSSGQSLPQQIKSLKIATAIGLTLIAHQQNFKSKNFVLEV